MIIDEETLGDRILGTVKSLYHICQGCEKSFLAIKLYKGNDGKFYCDDCLKCIEDDEKEG